jgi:hypothetical protein
MKKKQNPLHNKYTEFTGSFQAFTGELLSPDAPIVKARERKGWPRNSPPSRGPKKRGGNKPKE